MSTEQKFVLTQDTQSLFREIDLNVAKNEQFLGAADQYFGRLQQIVAQTFSDKQVIGFNQTEIDRELRNSVEPFLAEGAACICLDRFLLKGVEEGETKDQFYRFGICRASSGERVNRQGRPDFSDQFQELLEKIPDIQDRVAVIVDDGLFTGGTVKEFLELAEKNGVKLNVGKIIGFLGDTRAADENTELVEPIADLYEWIDIRDFSPLGGKLFDRSAANKVTSFIPYLYPWSEGASASLDMSGNFFGASTSMIQEFKTVIRAYEDSSGSPLTFRRLVKAGFPLPTNAAKTIPVSINDGVIDYLDRCLQEISREQNRPVTIYDMDGTLYQFDGKNNGYQGSSLQAQVQKNAMAFIMEREGCSDDEAQKIMSQGLQNPVGISQFLAERYAISRNEYFDIVWNIDPRVIVKNYETAAQSIKINRDYDSQEKTILLTSAPRVWAKNVLAFLGVTDCFEAIYTGDQFQTKEDVFKMLAGRYNPSQMLSVGDQEETDIIPARKYGISGFQVKNPQDLEDIMYIGGILAH